LIVGTWNREIYEESLAAGFRANGWDAIPFDVDRYCSNSPFTRFLKRARAKLGIAKLNNSLIEIFKETLATAVLFYRSDFVLPDTLKRLKRIKSDVTLLLYHNDNPFVGLINRIKNRHYLASIPIADVTLAYRPSNLEDARRYRARRVELFLPYYLTYRHRPIPESFLKHGFDVLYIGHYEPDGRAEILDFLVQNGIQVRVFGTRWEAPKKRYNWLTAMDIREVWGEEYSRLLSSAKIALVFLSRRNRDVYTRRCFEITACGTLMMAPRTRELEQLFTNGKEAVYYDSNEDLLHKIRYYLTHEQERYHIAHAGRQRCVSDAHNEVSRTKQLIEIIEKSKRT